MRKISLIISILLVIVLLAGCGAEEEPEQNPGGLEPLPEVPAYEGTSVADSPFVGIFRCSWSALEHSSTDDSSWDGRISYFTCYEDGTFILAFDSLEETGMVTVKGTVSVKDDVATCTIKERSADNYLGADLESFQLKLIDENELRYKGEQQGTVADRDIFSKEG